MNKKDFDELRKNLFDECINLSNEKSKDYSKGNEDCLINFKENEKDFNVDKLKSCGILLKKQINAVYSYIKSNGQSESEPIKERIKDSINYLILLYALIKEED